MNHPPTAPPSRSKLIARVRDAWPDHADASGFGPGGLSPMNPEGRTAALIDLAVDTVLDALDDRPDPEASRVHPFRGNVLVHVQAFGEGDSDEDGPEQARAELRTPTEDLDHAMILTSDAGYSRTLWWEAPAGVTPRVEPMHRPVLDLDMPCRLLPSSTPGHHHLLIDRPIPWGEYVKLLDALAEAGIVERGYVGAAKERGHTGVRVPWWPKGTPAPAPPAGAELLPEPVLDGGGPVDPWSPVPTPELAPVDLDPWSVAT